MTFESTNSYEDPQPIVGIFAKGDPPPNGTDESGGTAPAEGDPPPNGKSGDPPPNGSN